MRGFEEIKRYLKLLIVALTVVSAVDTIIFYSVDFKVGFYLMVFATVVTAVALAFKDVYRMNQVSGLGTAFGFALVWILVGYLAGKGIGGLLLYASIALAIIYDIIVSIKIIISTGLEFVKYAEKGYPRFSPY